MDVPTIARHEFKYAIPGALVQPIRRFLEGLCALDEYAVREPENFYTVTNLYLDNHRFQTYRDNQEHKAERFKLRIRTYGTGATLSPVNFEVKRRVHDFVVKSCARLPGGNWQRFLDAGARFNVPGAEPSALDQFLMLARRLDARPKMLIRYERLAFRSLIDDYVRVTFDRRLVHQPMACYSLEGDPCRWRSIDSAKSGSSPLILELKFINAPPPWLRELVRRFELVRHGCSKYARAVRREYFEKERAWDCLPSRTFAPAVLPPLVAPGWGAPVRI